MMLIFDPDPPNVRWCRMGQHKLTDGKCEFNIESFDRILQGSGRKQNIKAMGYLLYNGAEIFDKPVSRISGATLEKIEKCLPRCPVYNDLTYNMVQYWTKNMPRIPHLLFCDTAYFTALPEYASTYAVPYELRRRGIKRYGGHGLCHQWAWRQVESQLRGTNRRVLSIYLGNHTNIAAIVEGQPVETTVGFTPVEGIMSSISPGDIDPTIISQLYSTGVPLEEIHELLSRESGFKGLLGKNAGLRDILKGVDDINISKVRDIFSYSVRKQMGALVASMGGVDAIVFLNSNLKESTPFILDLCNTMKFLGLSLRVSPSGKADFRTLTLSESKVKVFCLMYNKWNILADHAKNQLRKEL
jgi:acetate kinase